MPERPLRVAFCVDNLNLGGTELNAVRLAERLDRSRFELRVVAMRGGGPLAERYRRADIPVDVFSPGSLVSLRRVREGLRLTRYLRRHGVDIFHAHDLYSNLFGCPWARVAGTKVIASRRWQGIPVDAQGRPRRLVSRIPYRIAHIALANSPGVADMLERIDRVPRRRIAVVPNFVDEDAFEPLTPESRHALRRELGLSDAEVTIGIVANLRPVKDHATLLRAVKRVADRWPHIRLVLVGDGTSRGELQHLSDALGIQHLVVFAGLQPNQPNLNHLFDISVLCSKREGLPNSVLEAMAAGKPVVATNVGAVADAVVDGVTGLLVRSGDPEQLAAALETLLADPARARQMGETARQRAQERFSASAALGALEALYEGLVQRILSVPATPQQAPAGLRRDPHTR
jgi:glycosyltransferase involved in cell wall biosynthesis